MLDTYFIVNASVIVVFGYLYFKHIDHEQNPYKPIYKTYYCALPSRRWSKARQADVLRGEA